MIVSLPTHLQECVTTSSMPGRCVQSSVASVLLVRHCTFEPRSEKNGLRGFRPGPTQTGLYNHTRWL